MQQIRLIQYQSDDYYKMLQLRDEILRKPHGLHFTKKYLEQEVNDWLIGCFHQINDEEKIIGCCVLTPLDESAVQLRQMAVAADYQRSGIGNAILQFAEEFLRRENFSMIIMHARKTAIPFYEQSGYKKYGDEFLEVSIPHFEMRKKL